MDNVLSPAEIDFYIETMREHRLDEIGNECWLDWHDRVQKLNQQAVIEATALRDEQVKESLVTLGKSPVLVHEAILISVWRQKVLPHLLRYVPNPATTFIAYTVLYHEGVVVSLLELTMFYSSGCERLGECAADLLEYAYDNAAQLLALKCSPASDCELRGAQELLASRDTLQFAVGIRSLSIVRYLAEYLDKVSLGVVSRMYETLDVPALCVQLLLEKPWSKDGHVYNRNKWVAAMSSDALNTTEAQVWLTLRHLLLDKACLTYYPVTEARRTHLLKLAPLLAPTVLDQLSPLLDLQRFLCHLATFRAQAASTKKPFLLETILEIRNAIVSEGQGRWKKIAKAQIDVIFCNDKGKLAAIAQKLASAYNTDVLEKLEEKPPGNCAMCGQPAIQRCSKCKNDFYCSRQCQVADWANHKMKCTPETAKVS